MSVNERKSSSSHPGTLKKRHYMKTFYMSLLGPILQGCRITTGLNLGIFLKFLPRLSTTSTSGEPSSLH